MRMHSTLSRRETRESSPVAGVSDPTLEKNKPNCIAARCHGRCPQPSHNLQQFATWFATCRRRDLDGDGAERPSEAT